MKKRPRASAEPLFQVLSRSGASARSAALRRAIAHVASLPHGHARAVGLAFLEAGASTSLAGLGLAFGTSAGAGLFTSGGHFGLLSLSLCRSCGGHFLLGLIEVKHPGANLFRREFHAFAARQGLRKRNGAVANADKARNRHADSFEHAADLAIATLADLHEVPVVHARSALILELVELRHAVLKLNALLKLKHLLGLKLADGTVRRSNTIEEMARAMDVPVNPLRRTISEYNEDAAKGLDRRFGKRIFTQAIDSPPYYWGREAVYVHMTLGGLAVSSEARLLDRRGMPIPGFWAAGETTGGIFGRGRPGGMSLITCLVQGRDAGRAAAERSLALKPKAKKWRSDPT